MNYSTHRIRYYAPISHKGRARQIGMKADGTWQQKCSKDWIDSDEYLSNERLSVDSDEHKLTDQFSVKAYHLSAFPTENRNKIERLIK